MSSVKHAGVVFFSRNDRKDSQLCFLLGREGYEPGWRDSDKWGLFSGKLDRGESAAVGAARECYEETAGTVMSLAELRQLLSTHKYSARVTVTGNGSKKGDFVVYFVYVKYAHHFPEAFQRSKSFVQYTGGSVRCIEKNAIKWFSASELRRDFADDELLAQQQQQAQQQQAQQQEEPVVAAVPQRRYGKVPRFRRKCRTVLCRMLHDREWMSYLVAQTYRNHQGGSADYTRLQPRYETISVECSTN